MYLTGEQIKDGATHTSTSDDFGNIDGVIAALKELVSPVPLVSYQQSIKT